MLKCMSDKGVCVRMRVCACACVYMCVCSYESPMCLTIDKLLFWLLAKSVHNDEEGVLDLFSKTVQIRTHSIFS